MLNVFDWLSGCMLYLHTCQVNSTIRLVKEVYFKERLIKLGFFSIFLGREEFTGLDNDALDFSQLEDFIANETDTNCR